MGTSSTGLRCGAISVSPPSAFLRVSVCVRVDTEKNRLPFRCVCVSFTATRVAIATVVGIPASNLAIQRRIYFMVRKSSSNETTAQVRDLPPALVMARSTEKTALSIEKRNRNAVRW